MTDEAKEHNFGEETDVAGLLADLQHLIGNGGIVDGGRVSAASLLIVRELRRIRQALEAIREEADSLAWDFGLLSEYMREGDK